MPMLPPMLRHWYTCRYISCWSTKGIFLYSRPSTPPLRSSRSFSLIRAVPFPLSPPNSRFTLSSVSEVTSITSAIAELTDFGSRICIRGESSVRNLVPSPNTRHGSSGESQTRPVPGSATSAARATGTMWKIEGWHLRIMELTKTILTAIHKSGKKSNGFSFHTLGSGKKLDMSVCLPIYFQADEQRVKKLRSELFYEVMETFHFNILDCYEGHRQIWQGPLRVEECGKRREVVFP